MAKLRMMDDLQNPVNDESGGLGPAQGDLGNLGGGVPDYGSPTLIPVGDKGLAGRGGTSPFEEFGPMGGGVSRRPAANNEGIAPRRPDQPTPHAGASETLGGPMPMPSMAPEPFSPMGMPMTSKLARPGGGSLYGSAGGLQGGGLGVPFDPTSDLESDPISTLMMLLQTAGKV